MLTVRGRCVRVALTLVVFGLLLVGTVVGQDDAFPFGPFRMYATTSSPDDPVSSLRLDATDVTGRSFTVRDGEAGMRRAELEGELAKFEVRPSLMQLLIDAHQKLHPEQPRYVDVRLVVQEIEMRGGRPTGRTEDQLAVSWSAA